VIAGRIFDDRGEGLAGVEIELLTDRFTPEGIRPIGVGFAQTEAQGVFRLTEVVAGDYYVRAYAAPSLRPSKARTSVYRSTFYPGVAGSGYAQRVNLASGQELFGIDFALTTSPTRRVAGVVVDPMQEALSPRIRVQMKGAGRDSINTEYTASIDAEGRFEVSEVVPGEYLVSVIDPTSMTSRWISATKAVAVEDDIVDLTLRAQLGAHITGRVVRDDTASRTLDPAGVNVVLEHRMSAGVPGIGWIGVLARGANNAFRIGSDGAFSIESPGGVARVRVSELPQNWMLKAVRLDGVDLTDEPFDFGEGTRRLDIVLTDRLTRVRGRVSTANGGVAEAGAVLVFAEDSSLWGDGSRYVGEAFIDSSGQFELSGMPPAGYLALAIEGAPLEGWTNPEILSRLRIMAMPFRLGEGEERALSLRLSTTADQLLSEYR
jgi:hypothetical protein